MKNIYDTYPDLIVAFSGSSILEIFKQDVDLSRRVLIYELPGLSFREFLSFAGVADFEPVPLTDILPNHREIALSITGKIKPLRHFKTYLQSGYYPFFVEENRDYAQTLEQIIRLVVETDLNFMEGYDPSYSRKMLQLLRVIAGTAPFKPNISKLNVVAEVSLHPKTDFLVLYDNRQHAFEVGGSNKKTAQIQQLDDAFLALDDIETGFSNQVPLWLFGFLY